jgi:hypothetical protein
VVVQEPIGAVVSAVLHSVWITRTQPLKKA